MADPTEPCSPHGWTLDTLEKFLSDKISALDRFCNTSFIQQKERVDMALAASDKAITKAEQTTEKRFEGVNEFRAALSDQAQLMLTRTEYQASQQTMNARIAMTAEALTKLEARLVGKHEGVGGIGSIVIGVAVALSSLVSVAALIITLTRHL